jgi:hypothetical protein
MGNNIAELKARLASLNRKTSKNTDIWKPKDEHDVRILSIPGQDAFQERTFHFNVGDAREVLCPKANFGDECVICDFAETLRSWKDEKGRDKPEKVRKDDFEIFKKIQATAKAYLPMVERTDDGKSISAPAWWGLTQNQANQVLEVCTDPDRLRECGIDPDDSDHALDAITSPKKAFDLHVSFKKPGEKGNTKSFTVVDIKPKYKPSPLTGKPEKDAELIAEIKPLSEVFVKVPSSEVEKIFAKFIGGAAKEAKPEGGKEYAPKGKDKAAAAGVRDVDTAFEDLLNSAK